MVQVVVEFRTRCSGAAHTRSLSTCALIGIGTYAPQALTKVLAHRETNGASLECTSLECASNAVDRMRLERGPKRTSMIAIFKGN